MATKQFFSTANPLSDALGNPLSLGTVKFKVLGSDTPFTTYKDSSLQVANDDPLVLDGSGRGSAWFNGNCDVEVYDKDGNLVDSDDAINPEDNIIASNTLLVPNGSFENDSNSDGIPDGWTLTSEIGSTNAIDATVSFDGAQSFKFTSTGSGGGNLVTDAVFAVNDVNDLIVEFNIKSTVADVRNIVRVEWFDKDQITLSNVDIYDEATANPLVFTKKRYVPAVPSSARFAKIRLIGCDPSDSTSGTTHFENIRVYYELSHSGIIDFKNDGGAKSDSDATTGDGTDNAQAFADAFALAQDGDTLFLPGASQAYRVTSQSDYSTKRVKIIGVGWASHIFFDNAAGAASIFYTSNATGKGLIVDNIRVTGTRAGSANQETNGAVVRAVSSDLSTYIRDVGVLNCYITGMATAIAAQVCDGVISRNNRFEDMVNAGGNAIAAFLYTCRNFDIDNNKQEDENGIYSVQLNDPTNSTVGIHGTITKNTFRSAVALRYHRDVKISENAIDYPNHAPSGSVATITGATQANPVVVTATAHPFSDGQQVFISNVVGMIEINSTVSQVRYTVANSTANTFELLGINGTGFTAYTSGGSAVVSNENFGGALLITNGMEEVKITDNWLRGADGNVTGTGFEGGVLRITDGATGITAKGNTIRSYDGIGDGISLNGVGADACLIGTNDVIDESGTSVKAGIFWEPGAVSDTDTSIDDNDVTGFTVGIKALPAGKFLGITNNKCKDQVTLAITTDAAVTAPASEVAEVVITGNRCADKAILLRDIQSFVVNDNTAPSISISGAGSGDGTVSVNHVKKIGSGNPFIAVEGHNIAVVGNSIKGDGSQTNFALSVVAGATAINVTGNNIEGFDGVNGAGIGIRTASCIASGNFIDNCYNAIDYGANACRLGINMITNTHASGADYSGTLAIGHFEGTGSPESVVGAGIGSTYTRLDGGAGTSQYFKESGTGDTGWVAK